MNGQEHYAEAERIAAALTAHAQNAGAVSAEEVSVACDQIQASAQIAQVHATLALAAAQSSTYGRPELDEPPSPVMCFCPDGPTPSESVLAGAMYPAGTWLRCMKCHGAFR